MGVLCTAAKAAVTVWLMIVSVLDIRTRRVPVWLLMAGGVCAAPALLASWGSSAGDYADILGGMLPGALLLGIGFGTRKVGYGDGAVALLLGAILGSGRSWMLLGMSMFFISCASLALLALRKAGGKTKIPYLPFLTAAWLLIQMEPL